LKTLILTEKPSVARDFANALSSKYSSENGYIELDQFVISWAIGHLLTPYDPEDYDKTLKKWNIETLPIIPIDFKYKSISSTKSQLEILKKIFKRSDINRLIVATDAGREGELIARLILNETKTKLPALRFFTSDALTKEVILKELKKARPLKEFDRLYIAGCARQKADWLVGMNLTRVVSIKLGDLFSVGRVQTAVLELIVQRREEIDHFVPKDYFELKANFKFKKDSIDTYWFDPKLKVDEKRKDKKEDFEDIIKKIEKNAAKVIKKEETERTHYPEGLYSLTELQRKANSEFGFSAQKTLDIAQSLYEKYKVLSYPRTDSKVMGESSLDLVKSLVYKFKEIYPDYFEKFEAHKVSLKNKNVFDNQRLTDHHGLIPLKEFKGSPDSPEGKIYYMVLRRFISNFLSNHRFLEVDIEIECEKEFFKARARKIIEMGFKSLEETFKDDIIKNIDLGESGQLAKSEIESKKTRPPFEYTESSLLYDMTNPARLVGESEYKKIFRTEIGLGTQATRANIIETLIKRNYIKRNGKNLIAIEKGVELIKKLKTLKITGAISSVKETAKWEIALHEMSEGLHNDETFIDEISDFVTESILEWKKEENVKRDNPDRLKKYSKGRSDSKFSKEKNVVSEVVGSCPLCQKNVVNYPKSYSCEGWKSGCKFTIWKTIAGANISATEAKKVITKKKSGLIKTFKSKAGKKFEAYLVLGSEGKIEFEFNN
jgi:DNA topoisomerase-3